MTKKRTKKSHAHFQISPQKNQSTFWYDWFFEILIIAFLAMMTFFVGGFEHILGCLIFLFVTGIILMCQYMERAFDTPQPTHTFIYGAGSVRRGFAAHRELYRQRKKRYKWKW